MWTHELNSEREMPWSFVRVSEFFYLVGLVPHYDSSGRPDSLTSFLAASYNAVRCPRRSGGIGRHVRLRGVWGNPWGFESPLRHQILAHSRPKPLHAKRGRPPFPKPVLCTNRSTFAGCVACIHCVRRVKCPPLPTAHGYGRSNILSFLKLCTLSCATACTAPASDACGRTAPRSLSM